MSTPETTAAADAIAQAVALHQAEPKPVLHANLLALDREAHRSLRLKRLVQDDYTPTRGMNSMFVSAVEMIDACREYPLVFVRSGESEVGKPPVEVTPVAVLGLKRGENLYLQAGGAWSASYVPAFLRSYPFAMVRTDETNYVLCFDRDWSGFSEQEGEALFDDKGEATEFLRGVQSYLEALDTEMQRTRAFGKRLIELNLLQDMRFDATMEGGQSLTVDGFMAIDTNKLGELPEATVMELHRSGMLALIHAQIVSMGNMRRLVEQRVRLKLPV